VSRSPHNTVRRELIDTAASYNGEPVRLPRIVIEGQAAGPTLTITAAQHGRELNGVEACRRLIDQLADTPLRGTVQIFPVVNPPAIDQVRQVVPGETQNLNRIWPGDENGTNTERLAAAVAPYIVESDWLIDLHGWSDWTVDVVLTGTADDPDVLDLARACGLGYVFCNVDGFQPGNLKTYARQHGVIPVGFELTPQWRLREAAVALGVRGLLNGLKHAGLIDGDPELPETQWRYQTDTEHAEVNAEQGGLFLQHATVGARVKQDELLGELVDYATLQVVQQVVSPIEGVLINLGPTRDGIETNTVTAGAMLAQVWAATEM